MQGEARLGQNTFCRIKCVILHPQFAAFNYHFKFFEVLKYILSFQLPFASFFLKDLLLYWQNLLCRLFSPCFNIHCNLQKVFCAIDIVIISAVKNHVAIVLKLSVICNDGEDFARILKSFIILGNKIKFLDRIYYRS